MVQSDLYRRLAREKLQKLLDGIYSFHLHLPAVSSPSFQVKEPVGSQEALPQALSEFAKLANFVEKQCVSSGISGTTDGFPGVQ